MFSVLHFSFPLALTAFHFFVQALLSRVVRYTTTIIDVRKVSSYTYRYSILPVAAIMSMEIVMNNVGTKYIPVSFVQTVRSLTPICTAIVTRLTMRKQLVPAARASLAPVCFGVAFATYSEVSFHFGGFVATILSCFLTAGKLALSSSLLSGKVDLNPVEFLYYTSPASAVLVALTSLLFERSAPMHWIFAPGHIIGTLVIILTGLASFMLNLSIFYLLQSTSALAVSVAGNVKVAAIIVLSVAIFGNTITRLGAFGCTVAILGCAWYGSISPKYVQPK